MSTYSLQADISTLQLLQQKVIDKLIRKQQSFQADKHRLASRNQSIESCLEDLKGCYQSFASQFKNQWLSAYHQLLEVFQKIIELYQMKVNRLEEEVEEKDQKIQVLEGENQRFKQSQTYYREFWQYPEKSSKASQWEGSSSTGKRVKISDVIAENSHNCSIQTPYQSSVQEVIAEEISENETETHSGRTLLQISEQLNSHIKSRCFEKEKNWQNSVSPIMSASSHQESPPNEERHQKLSLQITNRQNQIPSSKSVKMTKSIDSWKNQIPQSSSGNKLNQLRRSLIQRKKSDYLY